MATKKITDLVEITTAASDDVLPIVDVSSDITNKITTTNLLKGKQDLLESGTNIKTINSNSLLGSGNVSVQETLVSGTNIKTINSTSLLGSGDISIQANPSGGAGSIQFSDGSAFASDSNLFWDNTNKRLGIGTNSPTQALDVVGQSRFSDNILFTTDFKYIGRDLNASSIRFASASNEIRANISTGGQFQVYNAGSGSARFAVNSGGQTTISGGGSTSATNALLVQNSSGTAALTVKDDLSVTVGGNIIANIGILGGGIWTSVYRSSTGSIWGEISGTGVNSKMTLSSLIAMTGLPTTRPSNVGDIYIDTAANILSNGDKVIGVRQ